MDGDGARPIGRRLRQIRQARRKSLRVVAGLAGISSSHLHRIETGVRPLDSLTVILALADALQVAPSDLITLPVPAPGNGPTDGAINAVRLALRIKLLLLRARTRRHITRLYLNYLDDGRRNWHTAELAFATLSRQLLS